MTRTSKYVPLTDDEHAAKVAKTRAEMAAQLKLDFPEVAEVRWLDDHTVRAIDAEGEELARGQGIASLRAQLPFTR